jgi:membrane-anchored protein YejM (alkaline phosphatase superfamily)
MRAARAPPPVIIISIATLRADHVSARATPHIDALAREGLRFAMHGRIRR